MSDTNFKFLCIGDQHIQPNNIPQIDILIQKLEVHLQSNKYDFVALMGDCLHTHEKLYTVCLEKAYQLINMISQYTQCFVLLGNHDIINNSQEFPDCHPFIFAKDMKNVTIFNKMTFLVWNNGEFKKYTGIEDGIPFIISCYVPDDRFVPLLNESFPSEYFTTKEKTWKDSRFILGHQLVRHAKMGAIISEKGDIWLPSYPQLISGHIHDKQWVHDNMYYVGSVLTHAFGEKGDKTVLEVSLPFSFSTKYIKDNAKEKDKDTKEKDPEEKSLKKYMTEINLHLPEKKILYFTSTKALAKFDCKTIDENLKLKISVSGSQEDFDAFVKSSKYKEITSHDIKVIFKYKRDEIKTMNKKIDTVTQTARTKKTFDEILRDTVLNEKNKDLEDVYNEVVTN